MTSPPSPPPWSRSGWRCATPPSCWPAPARSARTSPSCGGSWPRSKSRRSPPNSARAIAQTYLHQTGTLVESPPLFVAHVVQQANGNPQALADLLADASKERVVDKQRIREMRHAAGVRYLDFTPAMIVALASVVGARYLAIGTGDTELYIFAGMLAAVVISVRVFLFRGAGKAN